MQKIVMAENSIGQKLDEKKVKMIETNALIYSNKRTLRHRRGEINEDSNTTPPALPNGPLS